MTDTGDAAADLHENRWTADAGVADREVRALFAFAWRDPKTWAVYATDVAVVLAAGAACAWWRRDVPGAVASAALLFSVLAVLVVAYRHWTAMRRTRRSIRAQCPAGTPMRSAFGPSSLMVARPDFRFEVEYAALTHAVQIGDVLVLKPRDRFVVAVPMELVRPQDLARVLANVVQRPMREASLR